MEKLAIITTHPIQYNAPLFRLLARRKKISVKVFYTWGKNVLEKKYDPGFGKVIEWDIPLLDGYDYTFVKNIAKQPGSSHFTGIDNPGLIDEIKGYGATALLVFGWSFKSHLQCLRYFHKKIPILFRGDSTLLTERRGGKKIIRTVFLKWVYSHIDYALFVGTHNRAYFKRHGLKDHQLVSAPHAINNERFGTPDNEYRSKAETWKQSLGISAEKLTVLYAGKLEDIKNPFFILDVADQLANSPIVFILVGNGPLEAQMKARAKSNEQVIFIDFQNQSLMPVVYRLGDIFLLGSKSETWGLGANEAMASGCAIALSDTVAGAIDLVIDHKNGFVFKVNDVAKCAGELAELAEKKDKLQRMKMESKRIVQHFSFEKIVAPIEALVENAV